MTKEVVEIKEKLEESLLTQKIRITRLKFYKDEIINYKERLDKLVKFYSSKQIMGNISSFDNRFNIYTELSDQTVKIVKDYRNLIKEHIKKEEEIEESLLEEKEKELKEKIEQFQTYFNEMKEEFIYFYAMYFVSENHISLEK